MLSCLLRGLKEARSAKIRGPLPLVVLYYLRVFAKGTPIIPGVPVHIARSAMIYPTLVDLPYDLIDAIRL